MKQAHDVTERFDAKRKRRSTFVAVRETVARSPLDCETLKDTLDATSFTPEEYEAFLGSCLSVPSNTPFLWRLLYQSAETHGVQPCAQTLVRALAESFQNFDKETIAECLQILQERNIPLDAGDARGMTPLLYAFKHYAWSMREFDILTPWLEAGASLNATDSAGNTFLHHAGTHLFKENSFASAASCYIESVLFLLKQGADVMACNHEGVPAHEAVRKKLFIEHAHLDMVSERVLEKIEELSRTLDKAVLQRTLSPVSSQGSRRRQRV